MAGASLNNIKSRIKSVEGTMQITKAMELVATSKLRHAKVRAEAAKPYLEVLSNAIRIVGSSAEIKELIPSPKPDAKTLYIVIAGDRGLAGGYNNNIFKLASLLDKDGDGLYLPIGKKALEYFARRKKELFSKSAAAVAEIKPGICFRLADEIFASYMSGNIASVKIVYTRFVSMMTQAPVYEELLPLPQFPDDNSEPIFDCEAAEIFHSVIPGYIGGLLYSVIGEAFASECASRRSAMNSANKNAEEMISTLVLKFNRARQAVITQEITEIVSGAEAL